MKQTVAKYHSRIQFVFLPTRSPELNLIEVRWLWLHRQTISNSIFRNDYDIGKAVSAWTVNYNKKHVGSRIITNSLHKESICMFTKLLTKINI